MWHEPGVVLVFFAPASLGVWHGALFFLFLEPLASGGQPQRHNNRPDRHLRHLYLRHGDLFQAGFGGFDCTVTVTAPGRLLPMRWPSGPAAQRPSGPAAQRPSGPAAQRPSGTAAQRHSGTAARFQHAVVRTAHGGMAAWLLGTAARRGAVVVAGVVTAVRCGGGGGVAMADWQ